MRHDGQTEESTFSNTEKFNPTPRDMPVKITQKLLLFRRLGSGHASGLSDGHTSRILGGFRAAGRVTLAVFLSGHII